MFSNLFTHSLGHVVIPPPEVPGLLTEVAKPALQLLHNNVIPGLMKGMYNVATTCESDKLADVLAYTIGGLDFLHKHNVAEIIEKFV